MTSLTDAEEKQVRAVLGEKVTKWGTRGRELIYRRLRGPEKEYVETLLSLYRSGALDAPPAELNHAAARCFGRGSLNAEMVLTILMGRPPKPTSLGMDDLSASLAGEQLKAQQMLAEHFTPGQRYVNRTRSRPAVRRG